MLDPEEGGPGRGRGAGKRKLSYKTWKSPSSSRQANDTAAPQTFRPHGGIRAAKPAARARLPDTSRARQHRHGLRQGEQGASAAVGRLLFGPRGPPHGPLPRPPPSPPPAPSPQRFPPSLLPASSGPHRPGRRRARGSWRAKAPRSSALPPPPFPAPRGRTSPPAR